MNVWDELEQANKRISSQWLLFSPHSFFKRHRCKCTCGLVELCAIGDARDLTSLMITFSKMSLLFRHQCLPIDKDNSCKRGRTFQKINVLLDKVFVLP